MLEQNMQSTKTYKIQSDKQIRKLIMCQNSPICIISTSLQILIYQFDIWMCQSGRLLHTIKRYATPRNFAYDSNNSNLLVTFSDNYTILYCLKDIQNIYAVNIITGIVGDCKQIKFNHNGRYIIFGNHSFFQIYCLSTANIQIHSLKIISISSFALNYDSTQVYLGKFSGQFILYNAVKHQGFTHRSLDEINKKFIFNQSLVQIQEFPVQESSQSDSQIKSRYLICVSYSLEISIIRIFKDKNDMNKYIIQETYKCSINTKLILTKQIQINFKQTNNYDQTLYMLLNEQQIYELKTSLRPESKSFSLRELESINKQQNKNIKKTVCIKKSQEGELIPIFLKFIENCMQYRIIK